MPTRPSTFLNWVPSGNPSYIQQPTVGQSTTGWVSREAPPFQYMNWLFYECDQWIQYFDAVIGLLSASTVPATATGILITTGDTTIGSALLTNLASTTGLINGMAVSGSGIPADTYVDGLSGTTVTLSKAATSNQTGVSVSFNHAIATGANVQLELDQLDANSKLNQTRRQVVSSAVTAVNGDDLATDTSSIAFTMTLPANPVVGWRVLIRDAKKTFATNNLTIARNGEKINGVSANFICNTNGDRIELIYIDSVFGWATYI